MADNKKSILVVDDQADSRAFTATVISETGDFEVLEAESGDEALAVISKQIPDLLILDVMMPGMTGLNLFSLLKKNEKTSSIPVIMLTGIADDIGMRFSAEGMGAQLGSAPEAFIEKPADPQMLQQEILKALGL